MWKTLLLVLGLVGLLGGVAMGQGSPIATTAFTRSWLRSTNANEAALILGTAGGGAVSNQVIVATVANIYTNNTGHYIQGVGNIGTTTAGSLLVNVTNSSNAQFARFSENVGTVGATTNQISFAVPPGGWWKYGSVTTTLADGSQTLVYYATNGSVSYASSAGSAATASTLSQGAALILTNGGWTANFRTNTHGVNGSNYAMAFWPTTPATLPGRGVEIKLGTSENDSDLMRFWFNPLHDLAPSSAGSELQWTVSGDIAISPGYQTAKAGHIQYGISGSNPRSGASATHNYGGIRQYIPAYTHEAGYTWYEAFELQLQDGTKRHPAIIGQHQTNNVDGFGSYWELSLLKNLNMTTGSDGSAYYDLWSISNVQAGVAYRVYTNDAIEGFQHRGHFLQSQVAYTATDTNVPLDFGKSASVVITPQAGVNFYTTNNVALSTNFQRMVFIVKPAGLAITNISYPSVWNVPTNISLPSSLPGDYYLRLALESIGWGESNKFVTDIDIGVDRTFAWDSDATNWFGRASVTNATEMSAINTLVVELKAANAWTNLAVLYVPLKDAAALNGENLKGNTFDMTWGGGVQHTNNGVGFNGSTGYGDTGYNPTSTTDYYVQDSALLSIWSGTTAITDSTVLCGAENARYSLIFPSGGGTGISLLGLNNANLTAPASAGDYRGLIVANRTASNAQSISIRATSASDTSVTGSFQCGE